MAISRKTDAPTSSNIDLLDGLVKRIEAKKSVADDARSDLGTIYKEAEDFGFNRGALKLAIKLRNMEADKRSDFLASLNAYCDRLGIFAQRDLWGNAPAGVGPAEATPARETGFADGRAGNRDHAARYEQGSADREAYEDGWIEGQAAKVTAEIKPSNGTGTGKPRAA